MLIEVENISKQFLDVPVLQGVSMTVDKDARIGLLGANGAGKTTLLNILFGSMQPDEGRVIKARALRLGYLRQNDALDTDRTMNEELDDAFADVIRLRAEIEKTAKELEKEPNDGQLLAQYDELLAQFEALDAYHVHDKTNRVLNGLGFAGVDRDKSVSTLSGGEKMRFAFAKMLLQNPDVLMLDEPTNHLDFEMLTWLEDYLKTYRGAVLVVSHDRYFLNAVAKDIYELERTHMSFYHGGYTSFVQQKAERRKTAMRAWEKQQEEIEKKEDYVRKNLVRASTTKMAQSRRRALEKMERLEKPAPEGKNISVRFDYDVEPFEDILTCEGLGAKVGQGESERILFSDVALKIKRTEKMAIVGLNGVGKSTFLKAIQDIVNHTGMARWGGNVRLGYFDQELAGLPKDVSVLEAVHSQYTVKTEYEIRTALGRLLIEGEAVFKKVRELSGAQRAKVAFAILQMRRANVLILDEPTNHLDYRAKEVMEEALRKFSGTIIAVSHDRYFLQRVPTAILEMQPSGFVRYDGNFDVYIEQRMNTGGVIPPSTRTFVQQEKKAEKKQEKQGGVKRGKEQRAQDAQRRMRVSELEKLMAGIEAELDEAAKQLAAPDNASDYALLTQLSESIEQNEIALDIAMEEWMGLQETE